MLSIKRPYLVIPKLIEQPTWGGEYIARAKGWGSHASLQGTKIGQSYELFNKSNLSLLSSSEDPAFAGELADPKNVDQEIHAEHKVAISSLVAANPQEVLGKSVVERFGPIMPLLIKFTQALGNSFQIHIKDGVAHPKWKPKPESWYYFEPGLITCGVKLDANWRDYEKAVRELHAKVTVLSEQVVIGSMSYEHAKETIGSLLTTYNPWQYVNSLRVPKDTLIDLSPCGIHHSWEEDLQSIPLGNVLYEVQLNVMDNVATIRNFDKGKMGKDGAIRPLHIDDYFALVDRSALANTPDTHMRRAEVLADTGAYRSERLMRTSYYNLDKLTFKSDTAAWTDQIDAFRHVFVQSGTIELTGEDTTLTVTEGHAAFVPAAVGKYQLQAKKANTVVLISY